MQTLGWRAPLQTCGTACRNAPSPRRERGRQRGQRPALQEGRHPWASTCKTEFGGLAPRARQQAAEVGPQGLAGNLVQSGKMSTGCWQLRCMLCYALLASNSRPEVFPVGHQHKLGSIEPHHAPCMCTTAWGGSRTRQRSVRAPSPCAPGMCRNGLLPKSRRLSFKECETRWVRLG